MIIAESELYKLIYFKLGIFSYVVKQIGFTDWYFLLNTQKAC